MIDFLKFKSFCDDFNNEYKNFFKYIVDINNKTEKLEIYNINTKFQNLNYPKKNINLENSITNSIGTIFITFFNLRNKYIDVFNSNINKLKEYRNSKLSNINDLVIQTLTTTIPTEFNAIYPTFSPFIINEFDIFFQKLIYASSGYLYQLQKEISNLKQLENFQQKSGVSFKAKFYSLSVLLEQEKIIKNSLFMVNETIEFLEAIVNHFNYLQSFIDSIFKTHTSVSYSSTKFYNGNNIKLSEAEVTFNNSFHPTPTVYKYTLQTLDEFIKASIYHITLNKKIITKCRNCNDYFIPQNKNNELYCDKVLENGKICKEIGKSKSFSQKQAKERPYDKLKKVITDRLRNNKKYKELYLDDFNNQYKSIYLKYIENLEKQNIEIHKFLTKYDMEFQKKHPIKKRV